MSAGPLRVAVVGPEASGKSTLAAALAERLAVGLLDDPRAALLARSGCHTLFEAARQRPIWRELLETQLAREAESSAGVLDTPVLDCWVLWQRWGWCAAPPSTSERLYAAVLAAADRYTHVVVLPARQVAGFQGHRFLDSDNAAQIARLTGAILVEAAPTAGRLFLEPGSPSSHLDAALALLGA